MEKWSKDCTHPSWYSAPIRPNECAGGDLSLVGSQAWLNIVSERAHGMSGGPTLAACVSSPTLVSSIVLMSPFDWANLIYLYHPQQQHSATLFPYIWLSSIIIYTFLSRSGCQNVNIFTSILHPLIFFNFHPCLFHASKPSWDWHWGLVINCYWIQKLAELCGNTDLFDCKVQNMHRWRLRGVTSWRHSEIAAVNAFESFSLISVTSLEAFANHHQDILNGCN